MLAEHPLALQLERTVSLPEAAGVLRCFIAKNRGKTFAKDQMDNIYYKHSRENILSILQAAVNTEGAL